MWTGVLRLSKEYFLQDWLIFHKKSGFLQVYIISQPYVEFILLVNYVQFASGGIRYQKQF